jgi:hypothetical protein
MGHWSYETLGINSRVDVLSSNGWPTLSQPDAIENPSTRRVNLTYGESPLGQSTNAPNH